MPHLWASADLGARERRWKKDHPICKQNITPSRKELFYYRPRRTSNLMGVTDHSALIQLFTKDIHLGRLGRWALKLRNYDFEVIHKDGSKNPADFLSRYPAEIGESEVLYIDQWENRTSYKSLYDATRNEYNGESESTEPVASFTRRKGSYTLQTVKKGNYTHVQNASRRCAVNTITPHM
ncbi:hypothetical protein AYI69_g10251 [Smittium culicis]|uniref:Reverse transcriptase RNase H-like domain-containing protein n=1 Tax=Smittium culicis TaxID=133412 RepID=A0A1R1X702_9FUNG|nr:hypothetical protein AYI69_g10251 [Smittium culicis]